MRKIVFLNGPKDSGKDYLGKVAAEHFEGATAQFKEALYTHTADLFGVEYGWLVSVANDRTFKEMPHANLQGYSPREALIFTSENVYKPIFGKDYFGNKTLEYIEEFCGDIVFITDSGFREEAETVVKAFGAENCLLVNLYREGRKFDETDSRGYINLDDLGVTRIEYHNDTHGDDFLNVVAQWLDKNLKGGW